MVISIKACKVHVQQSEMLSLYLGSHFYPHSLTKPIIYKNKSKYIQFMSFNLFTYNKEGALRKSEGLKSSGN